MTETTTWKRCPFCGNDDGVKVRFDGSGTRVWCFNCGVEGPWAIFGSNGTGESAWNDDRCTEVDADLTGYMRALADVEADLRRGMEDIKPASDEADAALALIQAAGDGQVDGLDLLKAVAKSHALAAILGTMAKTLEHVATFRASATPADGGLATGGR